MHNMNAPLKHLTVRSVPPELAAALEQEKRRTGLSLNQTVIGLLCQGLGVRGTRTNGLSKLAGTWTEKHQREFEDATAPFNVIDPELWR